VAKPGDWISHVNNVGHSQPQSRFEPWAIKKHASFIFRITGKYGGPPENRRPPQTTTGHHRPPQDFQTSPQDGHPVSEMTADHRRPPQDTTDHHRPPQDFQTSPQDGRSVIEYGSQSATNVFRPLVVVVLVGRLSDFQSSRLKIVPLSTDGYETLHTYQRQHYA